MPIPGQLRLWGTASSILFQVAAVGVARGIVGQKAKHKQPDEEKHDNVNNYFEGQHTGSSNKASLFKKLSFIIIQKHRTF
jgi:hypothetical protein